LFLPSQQEGVTSRLNEVYDIIGPDERQIIDTAVDMAEYKYKERLEKMKKGRGQSSAS